MWAWYFREVMRRTSNAVAGPILKTEHRVPNHGYWIGGKVPPLVRTETSAY
jgi:hypothetical protein